MATQQIRIGVHGRIGESTARSLGGHVDRTEDGFELVVPYVDQAQVTGLLVRLGNLHIAFHHVVVAPATSPDTTHTDTGATS